MMHKKFGQSAIKQLSTLIVVRGFQLPSLNRGRREPSPADRHVARVSRRRLSAKREGGPVVEDHLNELVVEDRVDRDGRRANREQRRRVRASASTAVSRLVHSTHRYLSRQRVDAQERVLRPVTPNTVYMDPKPVRGPRKHGVGRWVGRARHGKPDRRLASTARPRVPVSWQRTLRAAVTKRPDSNVVKVAKLPPRRRVVSERVGQRAVQRKIFVKAVAGIVAPVAHERVPEVETGRDGGEPTVVHCTVQRVAIDAVPSDYPGRAACEGRCKPRRADVHFAKAPFGQEGGPAVARRERAARGEGEGGQHLGLLPSEHGWR
eukprot:m.413028 g.413028  ORF g.413028 m.413028 type:complete len:320 (+) comp16822_c1_seq29:44-1003(+)